MFFIKTYIVIFNIMILLGTIVLAVGLAGVLK